MFRDKKENVVRKIRLLHEAYGEYKWHIVALTVLSTLQSFFEGVGITSLIPLFSFVTERGQIPDDIISQSIALFFDTAGIEFRLRTLLLFIFVLFFLKFVIIVLTKYITISIAARYEERTRTQLFSKIMKSDWLQLASYKIGYVENVLMKDVTYGQILLQKLSNFLMIVMSLLVYIALALTISASITLLTLVFGLGVFLVLKPLIRRTRTAAHKTSGFNKEVARHINEHMTGMKTVKALAVEEPLIEEAGGFFTRLRELRIHIFLIRDLSTALIQPLSLLFVFGLFTYYFYQPNFNVVAFGAIMFLIHRMFQYITQFQSTIHRMNESVPYVKNILTYGKDAVQARESDADAPFEFTKELAFTDVSFSYPDRGDVLKDLSFSIPKGKMFGIIGPSGSGKTTIVDIILRLLTPTEGKVVIDGKPIDEISLKEWRKHVGYVSQDMFLVNATVRHNIAFYQEDMSDEQIEEAAKRASIHDVIAELPDGYDTVIGERGVKLSAGQRQRIVIARVLARNPDVLVLDEATSALDNKSEKAIQDVIETLRDQMTVIVIAHRLSTVMNCDTILAIEDGTLLELAPPGELMQDENSYFYKMTHLTK